MKTDTRMPGDGIEVVDIQNRGDDRSIGTLGVLAKTAESVGSGLARGLLAVPTYFRGSLDRGNDVLYDISGILGLSTFLTTYIVFDSSDGESARITAAILAATNLASAGYEAVVYTKRKEEAKRSQSGLEDPTLLDR